MENFLELFGFHDLTILLSGWTLHSVGQISHVLPLPALDPGDEEAIGPATKTRSREAPCSAAGDIHLNLLRWGGLDDVEDAGDHSGIFHAVCTVRHGRVVLALAATHATDLSGVGTDDLGGSDFLDVHELTIPLSTVTLHKRK